MPPKIISTGSLVATASVAEAMAEDANLCKVVTDALRQHLQGICPHLDEHDRGANRRAVALGGERVFTSWPTGREDEPKLWIITEADRSATTLLWPSEY